jgi:hypothetical protein
MPVSRGPEFGDLLVVGGGVCWAEPPDVVLQRTAVGTVMPAPAQIWDAKVTALPWSAELQPSGLARQQAMSSMKVPLPQMHLTSLPQLAMPPPGPRNCPAQFCCR